MGRGRGRLYIGERTQVRCLGPGVEHFFYTDDPCRHRICNKCVKKIAADRVSSILDRVIVISPHGNRHPKDIVE